MRSQPEFSTNFHARFCVLAQYPPAVYNGGTERSCFHEHPASHLLRALRQPVPSTCCARTAATVTGYWYNPNIHPFTEYRSRRNCLRDYAASIELPLIERNDYGLRPFVRAVAEDIDGRCVKCYDMRLYAAAHDGQRRAASMPLPPRCSSARIRTTSCCARSRSVPRAEYGVTVSLPAISARCSAPGRSVRGSWACTSRNTAAASSPSRSAISRRRKFCGELGKGSRHAPAADKTRQPIASVAAVSDRPVRGNSTA